MSRALGEARIAAATLATLATALLGYREVFTGLVWWAAPVLTMALVLTTVTALRQIPIRNGPVRAVLPWFGGALMAAGVLAVFFGMGDWRALAVGGAQEIFRGAAPFALAAPGMFLVCAVFAVVALVCGWCALVPRAGILVALAGVAIYISPLLAIVPRFSPLAFGAFALAVVWLLWETGRAPRREAVRRRPGASLAVAAIAVVAALLAPGFAPNIADIQRTTTGPGGVFSGDINPMIALGENLANPTPTDAFRYVTGTTKPGYLRVVTVSALRGATWGPDPFAAPAENSSDALPVPSRLADTGLENPVTTEISIDALDTRWLPVPTPAAGVTGLVGEWRWATADQTIRGVNSTTRGQNYAVQSARVELVADDLRTSPAPSSLESTDRYLALPDGLSDEVTTQAAAIAGDETNAYDQAIALQRFFRSGDFRYDLSAPVATGSGARQADVIAEFLTRKTGYCIHFASTMAVMARSLGIPARIALGYLPGTAALQDGRLEYTVRSDQLHAWPELYFEGYGWIGFEPTTTRGTATSFAETPTTTAPSTAPTVAPTRAPSETPTATATPKPGTADTTAQRATARPTLVPAGIAVLVIVLLLLPAIARAVRGARRRRENPWTEFRAVAADLGVPPAPEDSPRAVVTRLRAAGVTAPEIEALAREVEIGSYARQSERRRPLPDPRAAIRALRHAFPRRTRVRARLAPRSLWARSPR